MVMLFDYKKEKQNNSFVWFFAGDYWVELWEANVYIKFNCNLGLKAPGVDILS